MPYRVLCRLTSLNNLIATTRMDVLKACIGEDVTLSRVGCRHGSRVRRTWVTRKAELGNGVVW
jgi:hypothetical protein